jgi:glycosyltransferase involved in cell wall biosynthesis
MQLSVIVPARNEEQNLPGCLRSLLAQDEDIFRLGVDWELIVVDDHSTDGSRAVVEKFPGIALLSAPELPKGWTGKANACWTAAQPAKGKWLLFTDADTIHEPGDMRRALHEADRHHADMLSYSPRQIVSGVLMRAIMPLIFADLARAYPPAKVNDPDSRIAAANGQFLLVSREAYFAIGGHKAVADKVLEDVELATLAKKRHRILRFRYAPDALSTRMYRTFPQMIEGWTKNLALLFPHPLAAAVFKFIEFAVIVGLPVAIWYVPRPLQKALLILVLLRVLWRYGRNIARSNFPLGDCLLSIIGMPLYIWLLWNSWLRRHVFRAVSWKGRNYSFR